MDKNSPPNSLIPKKGSKDKTTLKLTLIALGILLLTIFALLWPFATIWALNTLFNFQIAYDFWTWLSCWIILFSINGATRIQRN